MKPIECNTEAQIGRLQRDNWPPLGDPAIALSSNGERRVPDVLICGFDVDGKEASLLMTRAEFKRLWCWYNKDQKERNTTRAPAR